MNRRESIERPPSDGTEWLVGGGEMGKLIRSMDWSHTPLGSREFWPQSLRTTLNLCLASNFPIGIIWGPQRVQLYNDGYLPIAGGKHPNSLGQDFRECWILGWPVIGEPFAQATAGETASLENIHVFLDRNGYLEEAFFTSSFSPIRDDQGQVVGVFHPTIETTQQLLGERRLQALRGLASATAQARTVSQAVSQAVENLATQDADLPFVLIYLLDSDGTEARLTGAAGLPAGSTGSPERIVLASSLEPSWPVAQVLQSSSGVQVDGLAERFGPIACSPYPEPVQTALVMPIVLSGMDRPIGCVIAGVSPRRVLDEPYRTFYELLSAGIATALGNARAYEQERRRAEALAEIDRAKTVFFNNVSHEFRTPLTLMTGPLEEVMKDSAGKLAEGERHLLETAHRNALRLLKLVNSLLDFSRIEAGRIQANYTATDLAAFTAELASVFRAAIEAAGLELVVDCPPLPEPIFIDRDMWEKVVLNLLSNAFKFTFKGAITVRLRWTDGKAVLTVADTGTGVPPEHLSRLFERFHRVPNARGRTYEGSGIGLALVQELIKLHGGAIAVESEVDRGTVFTVAIPGGADHLPADHVNARPSPAPTAIGAHVFVEEALRWLPEEVAATIPESTGQPSAAMSGSGGRRARILWADDNADMREYVRNLLAPYWQVEAVADGQQALDAAQREVPDLVLADVMMPNLDGFGLLKALRADERTRDKPIILLSARAGEEARVEGVAAGADDYLVKPFSARELLARVRSHLELAAQRRELVEALRQSEERYRTLFTNMTEGFALGEPILDEQGKPIDVRYLEVNEAFHQQTGLPKDILGRPHRDFLPELEQFWIDRFAAVALTGQPDRIDSYSAPTRRHYDVRVFSPSPGRFAILFRDVTEQKRMEKAMQESESYLRQLIVSLPGMVWTATKEGEVDFVSQQWMDYTGTTLESTLGQGFLTSIHPEDRENVIQSWHDAVAKQTVFVSEYRLARHDSVYRWFSSRGAPLRDQSGEVTRWLGVITDITAQKEAETALIQINADLEQRVAERTRELTRTNEALLASNEELHRFAYIASHDLQTPLRTITGFAQILQKEYQERLEGPADELLNRVIEAARRMHTLIRDLLAYSRVDSQARPFEPVEFQEIFRSVVTTLDGSIRETGAQVTRDDLPRVMGDRLQLTQLLQNLIENAIKYHGSESPRIHVWAEWQQGEWRFSVRDNGIGIDAKHQDNIFEVFRRLHTQHAYPGTGIGLSICRRVVERHGGRIWVESQRGHGSVFHFTLPCVKKASDPGQGTESSRLG